MKQSSPTKKNESKLDTSYSKTMVFASVLSVEKVPLSLQSCVVSQCFVPNKTGFSNAHMAFRRLSKRVIRGCEISNPWHKTALRLYQKSSDN